MDELTRFARLLVERLAARPEGVQRPVSVAEIRKSVLSYRGQRRALGLESVEDYETVLLRLVAEERGYVRTLPAAIASRCREELGQPTPDLGLLEDIADATVQVTSLAVGSSVEDGAGTPAAPAQAPATPPSAAPVRAQAPERPPRPAARTEEPVPDCRFCQTRIPAGRTVTFCPWCGERLIPLICSRCGTELDSEWRHCITCGLPVQDPYRSA
jgi:hypothetical protein